MHCMFADALAPTLQPSGLPAAGLAIGLCLLIAAGFLAAWIRQLLKLRRGRETRPPQRLQGLRTGLQHASQGGDALQALQIQDLEVEPLLQEMLELAKFQAEQAAVTLVQPLRVGYVHVAKADPLRLRQVILNLLTNAIKYGRHGGHVHFELRMEAARLHLQVVDDGIGMHRHQLAHLFELRKPLGRDAASIDGSGIGLALARHWMHRMQGDIRVESQPGLGTRVHLYLPAGPIRRSPRSGGPA